MDSAPPRVVHTSKPTLQIQDSNAPFLLDLFVSFCRLRVAKPKRRPCRNSATSSVHFFNSDAMDLWDPPCHRGEKRRPWLPPLPPPPPRNRSSPLRNPSQPPPRK